MVLAGALVPAGTVLVTPDQTVFQAQTPGPHGGRILRTKKKTTTPISVTLGRTQDAIPFFVFVLFCLFLPRTHTPPVEYLFIWTALTTLLRFPPPPPHSPLSFDPN